MTCTSCGNNLESFNKFCPKCGAPVQSSPPPLYQGPSSYSSPQTPMTSGPTGQPRKKSGCGKVILILGIIFLVLGGAIAAAIYFGYHSLEKTLKSSEAYTLAVTKLKESDDVKSHLGEIKETGFPLGNFSQNADGSGSANFRMSVQGSKESGHYEVDMLRRNRVWRLTRGIVRTSTGDVIKVADEAGSSEDEFDTNNGNNNSNPIVETPEGLTPGKTISGGILNAKAVSLPQPAYPPIARQAHASGTVVVQVLVDESGNVVSAHAVSGHPLLQAASVAAARAAKFSPTKLAGKPVKVSGTIIYTFTSQ